MTTERAQGKTIEAPIATLETRAGQAVAETKNYVNWSRLTRVSEMVTDDAPRVLRMLAENDGQKSVALDHVRALWDSTLRGLKGAGIATNVTNERGLDLEKSMQRSDGELERARSPQLDVTRTRPGMNI